MIWRCKNRGIDLSHAIVMGVLNVTPDSFSDGGRFAMPDAAFDRARQIDAEGAKIIDIGGESTRPGAQRVAADQQIARIVPVIERIRANLDIAISVDTSDPVVMQAAIEAGACIVNDVSALRLPDARRTCAQERVGVCLMHMKGEPRSMQDAPVYGDVLAEVSGFLLEQRAACIDAGIAADGIVFDPGLGFGKTYAHNMTLLKDIKGLAALGSALLVGVSRKSFIGKMLGRPLDDRLFGGLGLAALAVSRGARIIRAHDIAPTVDAIGAVTAVIQGNA